MTDTLSMWTVYDHPRDWPDWYVARKSEVNKDGITSINEHVIMERDLDRLRKTLAGFGLACISRSHEDDPVILEVWL